MESFTSFLPAATRTPWLRHAWLGLLALLFSGCAVMFVAPYDEFTDRALYDLHLKTSAFIARASATGASYADSAAFYQEAIATVGAIRSRAEMQPRNENETNLLNQLEDQYRRLAAKHRLGPIRPSLAGSLEFSFRKLTRAQLAKKRSLKTGADTENAAPPQ
jgi:hypothetical protein